MFLREEDKMKIKAQKSRLVHEKLIELLQPKEVKSDWMPFEIADNAPCYFSDNSSGNIIRAPYEMIFGINAKNFSLFCPDYSNASNSFAALTVYELECGGLLKFENRKWIYVLAKTCSQCCGTEIIKNYEEMVSYNTYSPRLASVDEALFNLLQKVLGLKEEAED